jgi:uncharacterized protein (TIGR02145 family)
MRKLLLTTAAVAAAIGLAVAGEPSFGTFTDTRDGQTYKTVTIGTQTWMARNLNYQTKSGAWCYMDSASYCKQYGRLYDWKTAKTVCPNGWKLPSREDWDILVATAGGEEIAGKKLKSKSGWNENGNGTDNYGFLALPSGGRDSDGNFGTAGNEGIWWTATDNGGSNYAYHRDMGSSNDGVDEDDTFSKSGGFSVRCVAKSP